MYLGGENAVRCAIAQGHIHIFFVHMYAKEDQLEKEV